MQILIYLAIPGALVVASITLILFKRLWECVTAEMQEMGFAPRVEEY